MGEKEKQTVYDALRVSVGLAPRSLGPGSKEYKEVLEAAARVSGLYLGGTKPQLARAVVEAAGLEWGADCESTGDTVTTKGLRSVAAAVQVLVGAQTRAVSPPAASGGVASGGMGAPYTDRGDCAPSVRRPGSVVREEAWDALDAATREHMLLQDRIAAVVRSNGHAPLSPRHGTDPEFDLAWQFGRGLVICEVKTGTVANIRVQARLGLGQVLEYCAHAQRLVAGAYRPALALTEDPGDFLRDACEGANIAVLCEDTLERDLGPLVL